MISRLRGTVTEIIANTLTLDVQGVGYTVAVVNELVYKLNENADLHIYFHWNQESGPQLFGFDSLLSKTVFSRILTCSGCGPKIGLAVLMHMRPELFLQTIAIADIRALSKVSGIGPKKAELMIMQLKDKVSKIIPAIIPPEHETLTKIKQLKGALSGLHYKSAEVNAALDYLNEQSIVNTGSFDELLRKALSFLAKRL